MDKVGEQQACLCGKKAQTQNVGGGEANRQAGQGLWKEGRPGVGHSLQAGVSSFPWMGSTQRSGGWGWDCGCMQI